MLNLSLKFKVDYRQVHGILVAGGGGEFAEGEDAGAGGGEVDGVAEAVVAVGGICTVTNRGVPDLGRQCGAEWTLDIQRLPE